MEWSLSTEVMLQASVYDINQINSFMGGFYGDGKCFKCYDNNSMLMVETEHSFFVEFPRIF